MRWSQALIAIGIAATVLAPAPAFAQGAKAALKAWQQFLNVYPADRTAQEQVNMLSEKLAGNRT